MYDKIYLQSLSAILPSLPLPTSYLYLVLSVALYDVDNVLIQTLYPAHRHRRAFRRRRGVQPSYGDENNFLLSCRKYRLRYFAGFVWQIESMSSNVGTRKS